MPHGEPCTDSDSRSFSTHAGSPLTPETSKRRPDDTHGSSLDRTAIPDDTVQRYHYVYDSREGRAILHDRQTRAAYDWSADPRAPLLDNLAQRIETRIEAPTRVSVCVRQMYRRFALWCAATVVGMDVEKRESPEEWPIPADSAFAALFHAASKLDETHTGSDPANLPDSLPESGLPREAEPVEQVRKRHENEVIHATTIGLAEMDPVAARLLTVHCATDPDARRAAFEAGHMSERYAEFVAYQKHAATGKRYGSSDSESNITADARASWSGSAEVPSSPDAAARLMREAQVDWCLDQQLDMQDG